MTDEPLSTLLRVFVYGSLKPGGFYYDRYCAGKVIKAQPAIVPGCLYGLPMGYPAMTEGAGTVHGVLLTFNDFGVLDNLDELEGYDPDLPSYENEYERRWLEVFDSKGESLGSAWAYVMKQQQAEQLGGTLIPKGNWQPS
ncbi:hypothetical protein BST81_03940 [Leptolyngbya sp. 'hensonii']|uniref:gamma-glutamylcyclotransferase family protein n=1 Tax=Leptolyngbya sp. 'hensonii' TaxID=1922337 RepID=UPI00094F8293|nr:gamma-glutamylcyclotransferase [Leptolyngbya sp. 'hensonii']OLP19700.1 hypothetical protein BST81_03940 [Leptolyngbya sp. 'hensonii']